MNTNIKKMNSECIDNHNLFRYETKRNAIWRVESSHKWEKHNDRYFNRVTLKNCVICNTTTKYEKERKQSKKKVQCTWAIILWYHRFDHCQSISLILVIIFSVFPFADYRPTLANFPHLIKNTHKECAKSLFFYIVPCV